MKRIPKSLPLILFAVSVPFIMASGQEKKVEKKIKIVTVDTDGTKTIIDTTFTGDSAPGSIELKDGKVIYFETPGEATADFLKEEGDGKIFITTTIDEKTDGENRKEEKVIIMSGEGDKWTVKPSGSTSGHVYAYVTDDDKGEKTEKHVIVKSSGSKGAVWEDKDGKTFHITVSSDTEGDNEMTKYIIAKDGVVVTVESNDEAKANEIIQEIEKKLDVKSDNPAKKEAPAKPEKK